MSTISYFNFYSLDFSKADEFKTMIKQEQGLNKLVTKLDSALTAERMKAGILKYEGIIETIETSLSIFNDEKDKQEMPGYKMFKKVISEAKEANINANQVLCEYNGVDPFQIQKLTHKILGIPKNCKNKISDELRQHYFDLMKKSGLLITPYTLVNHSLEQPIEYLPNKLALEVLKNHPEKKTLTVGCGEVGKTYPGSCHFRRREDHNEPSFTIDISAGQKPDLVVDMHDVNFWSSVPNEHFENIFDHSYAYFLLDNLNSQETLQSIFRTLKPEGCLKMDLPFKEPHKALLRTAGFIVSEEETTIAKKPAVEEVV